MSNTYFRFKKFLVCHEKCAMKVGTDGVLLGAWADVSDAKKILDVGTGTGLVALMLAQRSQASICAIDIDDGAFVQACENINASPWADRIIIKKTDFNHYCCDEKYDLIVSNPPYFANSLKTPDFQRNLARHADELTIYSLITKAVGLLNTDGKLTLIIPTDVEIPVMEITGKCQLFPERKTYVRTIAGISPKRLLVTFGFLRKECVADYLTIELSRHVYSDEYINLTRDYYFKM